MRFTRFQKLLFACVGTLLLTGCADAAAKLIDAIVFAIFAGMFLLGFLGASTVVSIVHLIFARRLLHARPIAAFRRLAYAWWILSALGFGGALFLQAHFPNGRAGLLFVGPTLTVAVGASALWTSSRLVLDEPLPRAVAWLNTLAACSPFLFALCLFGYGVVHDKLKSSRRESARAADSARAAAEHERDLRDNAVKRKRDQESERQRRFSDCEAWTRALRAPTAQPGTYFGGTSAARIANEITTQTLERDHLDRFTGTIPCLEDPLVPNYPGADIVAQAYANALLSPNLWTSRTTVDGRARELSPRLGFVLKPDIAHAFAEMVDKLVREPPKGSERDLLASYDRCYLARHLLSKSSAPKMARCEKVLAEVKARETLACTRWVADLASPRSATYEATMFADPHTRERATAIGRRALPKGTFLDLPSWKPPCTDIYTEGFGATAPIEEAYAEMWMTPDAWPWIHAPPEPVLAIVRRGPRVPEATALAFARHIDRLAKDGALFGFGTETVLQYCDVARPYLALDASLVGCKKLAGD